MSTISPIPRDQIALFAACLYEPTDIVEIRALPAKRSTWQPAFQLADFEPPTDQNIYVGANPRRAAGCADAKGVAIFRCLFVDIDNVTREEAVARLGNSGLPQPTVVLSSGGGVHYYWRLAEPLTDAGDWTRRQKALIGLLKSDPVIHDPPRIMRMPGTRNHKRGVGAYIIDADPNRRYGLAAFQEIPGGQRVEPLTPCAPDAAWKSKLSRSSMNFMINGATGGARNGSLYKAACDAAGCGATQAEAELALIAPATNSPGDHPFTEREARDTIASAFDKPRTPSRPDAAEGEGEQEEDQDAGSQSEHLVRLALERYRFGRSTASESFAVLREGPRVAVLIRSGARALMASLCKEYRSRHGKIPNAAARIDALIVLEGECADQEPEELFLRIARHDGAVIIDLGRLDGQVVRIAGGRWEILPVSPVLFRRTVLTSPMPIPEPGGSLEQFRQLVNITTEDWPLFMGWWVSGWYPGIPHCLLMLGGEQGTGKSTCARFAAQTIDPSPAPLRSPPRCLDDWVVAASGSWMVVLDNLSNIPEWLADAICRAVTGEGLVKRALFTDAELAVLVFRRVVAITSIDPGALHGDMGDRLIAVDLERIDERLRLDDAELEEEFKRRSPRIFGALLDLAARVFAAMPSVKLASRPRMADFARVLGAVDVVLGTKTVEMFMDQRSWIAGTVVETNPLARAIVEHLDEVPVWVGKAGELYELLTPAKPVPDWPKGATGMGGQLRRLAPVLRQLGVEVIVPKPKDKQRIYTLRRVQKVPETTAQTAQPPEDRRWDNENDGLGRAVDDPTAPNRPHDRPSDHCHYGPENGDSGRLGGSGGPFPLILNETPPGPPHSCHACGRVQWWSTSGLLFWTCGGCHQAPMGNGPVIYWHGNGEAA